MLKVICISFVLTLGFSFSSQAASGQDAYDRICSKLPFPDDKNRCTKLISKYRYFELEALDMCAVQNFRDDKLICLDLIGDKVYESYEIQHCKSQNFPPDRVKCLGEFGKPYYYDCR